MNNPAPMQCPLMTAMVLMGKTSKRANIEEQKDSIMMGRDSGDEEVNQFKSNPLEKNLDGCAAAWVTGGKPVTKRLLCPS